MLMGTTKPDVTSLTNTWHLSFYHKAWVIVSASYLWNAYRGGTGPGIVVSGKQIDVDIALTQQDARSMASSIDHGSLPAGRRNLYLVMLLLP